MEQERDEVYERIPWETLEKKGGDRQWLVYAVAGAVTLGALAYSFTRSQPAPAAAPVPVASTVPATTVVSSMDSPPSTVASPIVVAEADLYAVDPHVMMEQAAAFAELFAIEYMTVDGAEASRQFLRSLMPAGLPLPEAPEGTQVFVDWVGALHTEEVGAAFYQVEVLVRSLVSTDDSGFVRRSPEVVSVPVGADPEGEMIVVGAPSITPFNPAATAELALVDVSEAEADGIEGQVLGGIAAADGEVTVIAMVEDSAGVRRPVVMRP